MEQEKSYTQIETLPPRSFTPIHLRSIKIPINRGSRYFDLYGVVHVVIYSKPDTIKLMPIKKNAMIDVWDVDEFRNQVMLLKFTHVPHPPINREITATGSWTINIGQSCKHKNGKYTHLKGLVFNRDVYVCGDCCSVFTRDMKKELTW